MGKSSQNYLQKMPKIENTLVALDARVGSTVCALGSIFGRDSRTNVDPISVLSTIFEAQGNFSAKNKSHAI